MAIKYILLWERRFSGMAEMAELAKTAKLSFPDYEQPKSTIHK